jgi:Nickel responsive protein SCO4226-like
MPYRDLLGDTAPRAENTVVSLMRANLGGRTVGWHLAKRNWRIKMNLYGILRRNGWKTGADLEAAAKKSAEVGDEPGSGVRWIRSYVLTEESGEVGTFCVYEGDSTETVRAHAEAAGLPCDEIIPIADTVIVRPDPVAAAS